MSQTTGNRTSWWKRLSLPIRAGLIVGGIGGALTLVGIFRGFVPINFRSIAMALLISIGSWGLVAWAVATAALDSENMDDQPTLDETAAESVMENG